MNTMKKALACMLGATLLAGATCLAACSAGSAQQASDTSNEKSVEEQLGFTKRDLDASYDESSATRISLAGDTASIDGDGATADGNIITITADGTYLVSGALDDGQIVVELPGDEDKAQIVLAGASIHNEDGPALQVNQADKVFVTLADGSENALSDGSSYALAGDDDKRDATIFSKDDLTINGSGSLTVTGNYYHGIVSKDDAVITGGTIAITAKQDAVNANDALKIGGGTITVNAGDDAFHSESLLYIADGTVRVESCTEGYEAEKIYVNGGDSSIVASDDGVNASAAESDTTTDALDGANVPDAPRQEAPAMPEGANMPEGKPGQDSPREGMEHPGGQGDGAPGDARGGRGMQGGMTPPDDGGTQGDARGQMTMPGASEDCLIQINGGILRVDAGGDGLDSNGSIEINGGEVLVSGASNSDDTGLDYEYEAVINGGTVILVGSAGMAEDFTGGSQAHLMERSSGNAGSTIEVLDASGNVLASYTAPKAFQMVTASAPGCASIVVR